MHLQSLFNEKKSYFSKSINECNVVIARNIEWEDCLAHITIYIVKITLQLVKGWLASCNNFQTTIGSFYSWIWMNLQDFMWWNFKQEAIWNYNWKLPNLMLHEFCNYDFKLIGQMGEMSLMSTHLLYIITCRVL